MTQEQWEQVLTIVAPIMLSGTVMIGTATWYLAKSIESVRIAAMQIAAGIEPRLAVVEVKIEALERNMTSDETFRVETRRVLAALTERRRV